MSRRDGKKRYAIKRMHKAVKRLAMMMKTKEEIEKERKEQQQPATIDPNSMDLK